MRGQTSWRVATEGNGVRTLVLGLGNPILADDSAGIRIVQALQDRLSDPQVTIMEASIAGLDFLEILAGYDKAIIIDAIQTGGRGGQIYRLDPGALKTTQHAGTPHDVNFITALELGKQLGLSLPEIVIFAIEVEDVTSFSEECTPAVAAAIPVCADMVLKELNESSKAEVQAGILKQEG